jgi:transitional endoplasmic reticulum ATPase
MYCQYWKRKLASNKSIYFPKTLVEHIADITEGFSFAYMKEAFVSALVSLATGTETGTFAAVIERQIKALKKELDGNSLSPSPNFSPRQFVLD